MLKPLPIRGPLTTGHRSRTLATFSRLRGNVVCESVWCPVRLRTRTRASIRARPERACPAGRRRAFGIGSAKSFCRYKNVVHRHSNNLARACRSPGARGRAPRAASDHKRCWGFPGRPLCFVEEPDRAAARTSEKAKRTSELPGCGRQLVASPPSSNKGATSTVHRSGRRVPPRRLRGASPGRTLASSVLPLRPRDAPGKEGQSSSYKA